MAEQMVTMELLKNDCGKDCQGMLREKLKKKIEIVIPSFLRLHFLFLCLSLSNCALRPTLEKGVFKACSYVDQYPLSNDDLCQ